MQVEGSIGLLKIIFSSAPIRIWIGFCYCLYIYLSLIGFIDMAVKSNIYNAYFKGECSSSMSIPFQANFVKDNTLKLGGCYGGGLGKGWGEREERGVWTLGEYAYLAIPLKNPRNKISKLKIVGNTYVGHGFYDAVQCVKIIVNGRKLLSHCYTKSSAPPFLQIDIPSDLYIEDGAIQVGFKIEPPITPSMLQISGDTRSLGFNIVEMSIE